MSDQPKFIHCADASCGCHAWNPDPACTLCIDLDHHVANGDSR
jgi:hypothetical protein